MAVFFLVYVGLYGGMNAYALWKVGRGIGHLGWWWTALVLLGLVMVSGPVLTHLLMAKGHVGAARCAALVAFTWMTVVMWIVFIGGLGDLWNGVVWVLGRRADGLGELGLSARTQLWACAAVTIVGLVWGVVEGRQLQVRVQTIESAKIPPGHPPLRLLHMADLHLGLTQGGALLEQIIRAAESAQPDMILCTGDAVDSLGPHTGELARRLARLSPPLGKVAVIGNHERYAGLDESLAFLHSAGFTVLRGAAVDVGTELRIAGIDDPVLRRSERAVGEPESRLLDDAGPGRFFVLLKHRPYLSPEAEERVDLQLSGHTHGGQIFPFHLALPFFYPLGSGWRSLGAGRGVYVSRGAGNWGPPLRVLAPREITLFILSPPPSGPLGGR